MSTPEGRPSRKRPINKCDDNTCDFTPLSKRINNLHLTRPAVQENFPNQSKNEEHHSHQTHQHNGHLNGFNGHDVQAGSSQQHLHHQQQQAQQQEEPPWVTDQMMPQYAPTIEQTDSPYYYEHNKLLFGLYLERLQRNPQNNRPFS